ncbi:uncharacterized protein LOC121736385 isoform X2 [Aricia agestis]|uniref:uncharacterized protein LOC121736385 isoform X2 n=1 Tax=Aricia agestis TaxID=91739 RepID=UPI001C206E7A|nr:uncharacterized protein LOC121736385 isoform X2 [Aricia agestis]
MEYLPTESVLKIRSSAIEAVRKEVNLHRPGEMEEAVRILDEWIHQQPHYIYKEIPKPYLESTIVTNKGSVEKSKAMIDKLCTLRTLMPDQFQPLDAEKALKAVRDIAYMCFLPQQTEDYHRLIVIKTTVYTKELLHLFYKASYMIVDYVRLYDYHAGVDVIYDLTDSDVKEALSVINFMEFKDCYEIINHSYSLRVRRYIVITPSKWVEPLVNVFKTFMKKKIADRIMVLKDHTELYQFYTKDILPKEYGGDERSLKELQDELFGHAASPKHREFREKLFEARTDETKRSPDAFNELYAGTTGTFRALTLD